MVNSLGINKQRFVRKLLLLPIVLLLIANFTMVDFVFAKKLELNEKQVEKIKTGLDLVKTFGNIVLSEDKLKTVFNTVFSGGEASVDITYGLLVLSAINELEFIDMVVSQRYKQIANDYFNSILDEKSNLFHYYKGIGFDLPKVLSGKIIGPISALTLNTFSITNEVIQIFAAFENLRTEKLYDGLWRYFDERRNGSPHNEAWELARYQMGWAVNSSSYLPQKLKSGDDDSLQLRFVRLWEKWGQHTTAFGVTAEAKQQFNEEMNGLVAQAIEANTLAEKVSIPSPLGNIQSAIANLAESVKRLSMDAVGAVADGVYALIKDITSSVEGIIARGGAGFISIEPIQQTEASGEILGSAKEDTTKSDLVENKPQPVENLTEPSFPQEQEVSVPIPTPIEEVILDSVKDFQPQVQAEGILSSVKDTIWCAIDPNRGPGLSTVLFSEIAWMGSVNSANDEWMRLKNISNSEINLAGWQVLDMDKQIAVVFNGTHTIPSQGTFLLERTNDDSLPAVAANLIYTGSLNNTNEALYLFDEKCVLRDKIVASPNWLAGDNASKMPMMRSNDLSWYTQGSGNVVFSALTNGSPGPANPYTAGSPPPVIYPRLLISEVQTAGLSSQIEEFVELYNPTQGQIDLTDWYIQKKTQGADSFSTFVSKNILSGKTIQAGGYFLIAREGSSFASNADAVTSYSLTDNNTLALKNPNGEITDKLGWGDVQDAENASALNPLAGQSLNRIWDAANQTYYDRDNNSVDFALNNPTSPNAQNIENDATSPAAIANLSLSNPTTSSIQLAWTAPGDDGSTGTAASYDMRYSTAGITADNFNSATQATGEPIPSTAGASESMVVSGLSAGTAYYFALKSSDEIPNTSALSNVPSLATTALPPPPQDTTAPQVTLNAVASSQGDVAFTLSWDATDSGGEASPSGVQSIFVEYTVTPSAAGVFARYNNNGTWTDWQAGSSGRITLNAQAASLSLRAQDGVSYVFQVWASDVAGNTSTVASASTTIALSKTVVINEIAWMGTVASANDEWIELYNTTASPIDLTGWTLAADDGSPSIQLAGAIGASSYFLLERTGNTTISNVSADQIYTGVLANEGEYLRLSNASGSLVDSVDASVNWFNGDNATKQTMERVSASQSGSSSSNWARNNAVAYNGMDVANNWINGTPRQLNSTAISPTTITELRFEDLGTITLTLLGSPYIAPGSITIPAGKTLVVEPGVRVKFQNNIARLTVQGTLKAQGTQANGITFTTTDGGAIWCGIKVASTSTGSQFDYVTLDKAQSTGSSWCNDSVNYAMYVDSSSVTMSNSVIQTGAYHRKLYLKNSNSTINALTVSGAALNADSAGIYIDGGSPTISSSTISNNSIGIFVGDLSNTPTIQNNTFTGNTYAVKMSSMSATLSGNTATGNTYNGIFIEGITQANMTWQKDTIPYIINKFTVSAGTSLTLQAGVVVKFINTPSTESEIRANGALITQGTASDPVVFTSAGDNTVGGSNSYTGGGITTSWKRIYIAPGSTGSQLTYTTFKYGGNTYNEAALYVRQSDVQLSNVAISNSAYSGIYSYSGTITGSNVTLSSNTYGFYISSGSCPALSSVTVTGTLLHPSSLSCSF